MSLRVRSDWYIAITEVRSTVFMCIIEVLVVHRETFIYHNTHVRDTHFDRHFEYKKEQILKDCNNSESDPLVKVANITSTLIFRTAQYDLLKET